MLKCLPAIVGIHFTYHKDMWIAATDCIFTLFNVLLSLTAIVKLINFTAS